MIDRKHDPVGAHSSYGVHQIRGREMTRSRQPDVLLKVVAHGILHGQASVFMMPDHPVVNPPEVCRSHLAEMADDDLEAREAIKDAVHTHA